MHSIGYAYMKTVPFFSLQIIRFLYFFAGSLFVCLQTQAQLCVGSLGDAVVNQTFGKGFAQPLSAATTTYNYISTDCPSDGSYTLRNTTVNCFGTWHTLATDHTGDGGNFMLVNASFDPSDFYVDTVKGLCANTVYEFAAWVMNVGRNFSEIRPNITFTIEKTDGTVLGSFSTGDVPATGSPVWNNYGLFFETPASTFDIVLRMRNNAPGGAGNDIVLDDIAFRPCGPKISAQISGSGTTADLCEEDTASFLLTSEVAPGYENPLYQWQISTDGGLQWKDISGANSLNYIRKTTPVGTYQYRLAVFKTQGNTVLACSIASSVVTVTVHANPVVDAGQNRVLIKGETATLAGKVTGDNLLINWLPPQFLSNTSTLNPLATPDKNITYTLNVSSVWGCFNSDTVFIKVVDGIYIPTAFTPNGDGLNDQWRIPDLDPVLGAEVWLFNRNGELVYHSKGALVSWDGTLKGKPQASNVFVYLIDFKKGQPPLKGLLTLIR